MPKQKPENKLTDEEQFERFKKSAEKAEVDETEARKRFGKLAKPYSGTSKSREK